MRCSSVRHAVSAALRVPSKSHPLFSASRLSSASSILVKDVPIFTSIGRANPGSSETYAPRRLHPLPCCLESVLIAPSQIFPRVATAPSPPTTDITPIPPTSPHPPSL